MSQVEDLSRLKTNNSAAGVSTTSLGRRLSHAIGSRNTPIILAITLAVTLGSFWALILPFEWGDDERQHVDTIIHWTISTDLPVITQDGARFFRYPREAAFTYLAAPPLPYLPPAIAARLFNLTNYEDFIAIGRVWSILCIAAAVGMTSAIAADLARPSHRRQAALWAGTVIAFMPKMGEIAGYTNSDSTSIVAAAFVLWVAMRGHRSVWPKRWIVTLGLAVGLLGLTRYNAYVAALPALALTLHFWWKNDRTRIPPFLPVSLTALAVWAWWPVRNLVLYGEPTGVPTIYSELALRGRGGETLPHVFNLPNTLESLVTQTPFIHDLWASFWIGEKAGGDGPWIWIATAALVALMLARNRQAQSWTNIYPTRSMLLSLIVAVIIIGLASAQNSLTHDYQAKGRYLLPLLPLGTVLLAAHITNLPGWIRRPALIFGPLLSAALSVAYTVGFFVPVALLGYG